jgi:6,7-dimethyl-8-ribityllumazine synthase
MKLRKGSQDAAGLRFGIVVATFNKAVTSKLLSSCVDRLTTQGVKGDDIEVMRVPGAFEIPLVARTMAKSSRFNAVICLGAVIRGDTPHFDYICTEVSRGIGQAALDADVPIIFGVLTTHTVAQAIERSEPAKFDRGGEAARSAIEMARVMRPLRRVGEGTGSDIYGGADPAAPQTGTVSKKKGASPQRSKEIPLWPC